MKLYSVAYRRFSADNVHYAHVRANSKMQAYDKAVYEQLEEMPYSAWVTAVYYSNGRVKVFNTHEGMPY